MAEKSRWERQRGADECPYYRLVFLHGNYNLTHYIFYLTFFFFFGSEYSLLKHLLLTVATKNPRVQAPFYGNILKRAVQQKNEERGWGQEPR